MKSGFLRHFLYFAPVFALILIATDFVFDRTWPPDLREIATSAVIAGAVYAILMTFWEASKKDKGEQDDQGN